MKAIGLKRIALIAFCGFLLLLGIALNKLNRLQNQLGQDVGESMIWAVSQATYLSAQVQLNLAQGNQASYQLNRQILIGQLSLLLEGEQRRYMQRLGVYQDLRELDEQLRSAAADFSVVLSQLRSLGNRIMIAEREMWGAKREQHTHLLMQVMFTIGGLLLAGAVLAWQLVQSLRQAEAARDEISRQHAQARVLLDAVKHERLGRLRYRDFVSLMSHQLRTPLAVIDSSAQRLLRQQNNSSAVEQRSQRIRESVRSLNDLIGHVLDDLRAESPDGDVSYGLSLSQCQWSAMVQEAVERCSERLQQREIRMRWLGGDEAEFVLQCDRLWCIEILANLLSNADKYSPADAPIEVTCSLEPERILCTVRDFGAGVAPGERESIFQRFYRSANTQETSGVGLGLAIARGLAQSHGGSLTVSNAEGGGACFNLVMPRTPRLLSNATTSQTEASI